MLSNTQTVTYKTVAYTLDRIYGPSSTDSSGEFGFRSDLLDLKLQIGHTAPKSTGKGESHVVTLWATVYDVLGAVVDKNRVYERVESQASKQDTTDVVDLADSLRTWVAANATDVYGSAQS
jgi:hypothetical protein